MADSSSPADPPRPVLPATPARQGRLGRPVFWVLVISTLLAAIGLFFAWTWKAPGLSSDDAKLANDHPRASAAFSAPEPAPATVQQGSDAVTPPTPAPSAAPQR